MIDNGNIILEDSMNPEIQSDNIAIIRRFNRFYTRLIGLITGHYLDSPFSLTEARVLYELANQSEPTATAINNELRLDAGYLSRILNGFSKAGLITKISSLIDGRASILMLTEQGRLAYEDLNSRSQTGIETMLAPLSIEAQSRVTASMRTIESLLSGGEQHKPAAPIIIRSQVPGDMGWVVKRHAELYAQEYGWDEKFEGLVAGIVADFVKNFDPTCERCWIAEQDGENVGCIFLVKLDNETAKLRMLLVDPKTRGMGLGGTLVSECVQQARRFGYKRMVLWTNSILHSAIHLYTKAGFHKVSEEPEYAYGHDLIFENWEMDL
jgi:DNA-binding MarR family transcriptional regulator/N-acetylglutamate synthase-like GNAT family acetyltransferase